MPDYSMVQEVFVVMSDLRESLLDVCFEIFNILNADGESNIVVQNTKLLTVLIRHRTVRHLRGEVDE